MIKVGVSELRTNLIGYLKRIDQGESIEITVHGRNVAKIIPPDDRQTSAREKLNEISKTCYIGDIISPINEDWDALQ